MAPPRPTELPPGRRRRPSFLSRAARHWQLWLPAVMLGLAGVVATQAIEHRFFMDLPMETYHLAAGILQGAIVAVPVVLYVFWRRAAEREKEALAKLRASEALRDDMTHMLVHDLKGPLASAMAALRIVLGKAGAKGTRPDSARTELLSVALASQERLTQMIETVLEVARLEAGEAPLDLQACDLAEVVAQSVEEARPAAQEAEVELRSEIRALLGVPLDADKIRRVVDNLLANALKHTPRGGTVQVSTARRGEDALVTVSDSGDGIREDLRERIFDKFGQAHAAREGRKMSVGLGLAFCKLVVEAHGGRIWVDGEPGSGSAFTFSLPLSRNREMRSQRDVP